MKLEDIGSIVIFHVLIFGLKWRQRVRISFVILRDEVEDLRQEEGVDLLCCIYLSFFILMKRTKTTRHDDPTIYGSSRSLVPSWYFWSNAWDMRLGGGTLCNIHE